MKIFTSFYVHNSDRLVAVGVGQLPHKVYVYTRKDMQVQVYLDKYDKNNMQFLPGHRNPTDAEQTDNYSYHLLASCHEQL